MEKTIEIPEGYEARIEGNKVILELKESDDEWIRKHIIKILDNLAHCHWDGNEKAKCIAYLERLKEQKPAESDAIKGGDFISDGKRVFLVLANVKERNLGEPGSIFCEGHILGVDGVVYCDGGNFKKFKRATSDERAKFIHDLKVGVKLKEQPAEWSEDIRNWKNIVYYVLKEWNGIGQYLDNPKLDEIAKELQKRYGPISKQEWSEEDENKFDLLHTCICRCITDPYWEYSKREKVLNEIIPFVDWLKSLRDNYKKCNSHWKPSEEQMAALLNAEGLVRANNYPENAKILASLYEDLKKL